MDDGKKHLRDEVAELSEAVRELRQELAASRNAHGCHGCHCGHTHWWPTWTWSPTVTYCGTTSVSTSGYVTTNAVDTTTTQGLL